MLFHIVNLSEKKRVVGSSGRKFFIMHDFLREKELLQVCVLSIRYPISRTTNGRGNEIRKHTVTHEIYDAF
jgi:hypothetical protein